MKFDQQNTIREYVRNLSDNDLNFVCTRMADRLAGDLADALNAMSRNRSIDEVLRSARNYQDLYDLCDHIRATMLSEAEDRGFEYNE